jgi:hypothetical protein
MASAQVKKLVTPGTKAAKIIHICNYHPDNKQHCRIFADTPAPHLPLKLFCNPLNNNNLHLSSILLSLLGMAVASLTGTIE